MSEIEITTWFGAQHLVNSLGETDKVVFTWNDTEGRLPTIEDLLVWHYCDRSVWLKDPEKDPQAARSMEGFTPAGVGLHELISVEPLHLEPSLYWPTCCGMHGFIREGKWVSV